jgi:hypothetical protein
MLESWIQHDSKACRNVQRHSLSGNTGVKVWQKGLVLLHEVIEGQCIGPHSIISETCVVRLTNITSSAQWSVLLSPLPYSDVLLHDIKVRCKICMSQGQVSVYCLKQLQKTLTFTAHKSLSTHYPMTWQWLHIPLHTVQNPGIQTGILSDFSQLSLVPQREICRTTFDECHGFFISFVPTHYS